MDKSNWFVVILSFITYLFYPVFAYCCGWLGGWILSQIIGAALTNGFNVLFNTTRFTPELIPIICGALTIIGGFFKTTISSSK